MAALLLGDAHGSSLPADDAAAHVLRSVGQNSAIRGSSPFTFVSLLVPLLVPQGL